jgi:hypothetical protein
MSTLLEQASLVLIPSGYKEDVVYSQIPTDGSGDLSFTRASNGTRINSAGLVEVCPWNLLENSQSTWIGVSVTVTTGVTDPKGNTSGYTISGIGSGNITEYAYQLPSAFPVSTGTVITYSIYMKGSGTIATYIERAFSGSYFIDTKVHTLSSEYQVFTHSYTATSDFGGVTIYVGNATGTTASSVTIAFPQVNYGSTAKPYFPTTDRLNVPRLTYQNGGGGCPSLLLEKQSTNISAFYDGGTGSFSAATVTDGTQMIGMKAFKVLSNVGAYGDTPYVVTNSEFQANTSYTLSFYTDFSKCNYDWIITSFLGFFPTLAYAGIKIDKATKNITVESNVGSVWTINSYSATQMSGEIYKIVYTCTPNATASGGSRNYLFTENNYYAEFAGIQAEASSYATSTILKTTSSSATRVADFATTNNISSLFGSTEGSFFIEMTFDNGGASGTIPVFLRSSTNSSFLFATYLQFSSNTVQLNVFNSSIQSVAITSSAIFTQGQNIKIAFAYKQNDFVLYVNGNLIGSDTSGNISANLAFIDLGTYSAVASTFQYTGTIGETVLFPTRLTNTELAQLTA